MIKSFLRYSIPPSTTFAQFPNVMIGSEQFELSFPSHEEGEGADESNEDVSTDDNSESEEASADDDTESEDASTDDDSESEE